MLVRKRILDCYTYESVHTYVRETRPDDVGDRESEVSICTRSIERSAKRSQYVADDDDVAKHRARDSSTDYVYTSLLRDLSLSITIHVVFQSTSYSIRVYT